MKLKEKVGLALICASAAFAGMCDVSPENDSLWIEANNVEFDVGQDVSRPLDEVFNVGSESAATVKISSLPSGVKYNASTKSFSGAPKKAGVYYVACSAKNANGFTHSAISKWTVGDADDGDYDDINPDEGWLDPLDDLWTGCEMYPGICYDQLSSASGLPAGVKYAKGGYITGVPTKPGKYKVTLVDKNKRKAVKTVIVQDSGSVFLPVGAQDDSLGKVTGSKVYTIGSKASISAKPTAGYCFAGWYLDEECCEYPLYDTSSGEYRKASDSVVVSGALAENGIWALFIPTGEDYVEVDCDHEWTLDEDSYYKSVTVDSGTLPTVTAKGLPPGIKWDKQYFYLYVDDRMKLKPGVSYVTISAKNLTGKTDSCIVKVVVPNIRSDVFDEDLNYDEDAYEMTAGVSLACVYYGFTYDSSYKISASGLPPGIKLVVKDGAAHFEGIPTKAGTYTVTLMAKRGKESEKATITINVYSLPYLAAGTFNGILKDPDGNNIVGSFTLTVAANGKQSVKVVTEYGTVSMSEPAWNCDYESSYEAYFWKETKTETVWFELGYDTASDLESDHQLWGTFKWQKSGKNPIDITAEIDVSQRSLMLKNGKEYENPWAVHTAESIAASWKSRKMLIFWSDELSIYTLDCEECSAPYFSCGTATVKVGKNGIATISGKFNDKSSNKQYSFSASSPMFFSNESDPNYFIFTPVVKGLEGTCCGNNGVSVEPIYWAPCED